MNGPEAEIVTVEGPAWRVRVWPALGGALVSAAARQDDRWVEVTRPVDGAARAARDPSKLGGFVMAPFCNRIDGGRFTWAGAERRVPCEWPADPSVAIHGLSWHRPWAVAALARDRLELAQHIADRRTAAGLVVAAPVAVIDQNTRENYGRHAGALVGPSGQAKQSSSNPDCSNMNQSRVGYCSR